MLLADGACGEEADRIQTARLRGDGTARTGVTHYGLHVENAAAAAEMFKQRGATVTQTNVSAGTESIPQTSPIRTWAASSWSKSLLNHCIDTQAIQHWK